MPDGIGILAIGVGNTRTRFGVFRDGELIESGVEVNDDARTLAEAIDQARSGESGLAPVVATVNEAFATELEEALGLRLGCEIFRIGRDLHPTLQHTLTDDTTLGMDRVLTAIGAYARAQQACVVIDAGTAVTVDFVDGAGVFHGGVIAPGASMMLRSLHEQTSALPLVEFAAVPESARPFGRDTHEAMLLGVHAAIRGLVHERIEAYATFYEGYPQIVATGGDSRAIFGADELVEHIVAELQLIGIDAVARAVLERDDG